MKSRRELPAIFHLHCLEVVSKRIEQVKALAIRHRDGFEDFCSLLFQIGSDGVSAQLGISRTPVKGGITRLRHMIWDRVEKLWLTSPM